MAGNRDRYTVAVRGCPTYPAVLLCDLVNQLTNQPSNQLTNQPTSPQEIETTSTNQPTNHHATTTTGNGDRYRGGAGLPYPTVYFRVNGSAESCADLRTPVWDSCRVPLFLWNKYPFIYAEAIIRSFPLLFSVYNEDWPVCACVGTDLGALVFFQGWGEGDFFRVGGGGRFFLRGGVGLFFEGFRRGGFF